MATRVMKVQDTFLWLTLNNPKFQWRYQYNLFKKVHCSEIRTWIWAIFGIVWRKTNIVKVTSLKIFSDFQDEKI